MNDFPRLIIDNKKRVFTEEEKEKIKEKIYTKRIIAQRLVLLNFDFSDEGDEYASLTHPDGTSIIHIVKTAQGCVFGGDFRRTCIFEDIDEIVDGIGVLSDDAKTTPYVPEIHDQPKTDEK